MDVGNSLVVFRLDEQRFALRVGSVERIVRAVEVTPVPGAPRTVSGAIILQGRIVPVINLRGLLGLPERAAELSDQLVIARTSRRTVALPVDSATVEEYAPQNVIPARQVLPPLDNVREVLRRDEESVLIIDLEELLAFEQGAHEAEVMSGGA